MSNPNNSDVTRAKVTGAKIGPRTLLQITGLDGVAQNTVELLMPHGFTCNPVVGSDVVLLQVLGSSDHVVALGGDLAGNAETDLAPGEFGLTDGTNKVLFKGGYLQLISPVKVRVDTPLLECTGEIKANCDTTFVTMTQHIHAGGPVPTADH
jgi:phage gp45-like